MNTSIFPIELIIKFAKYLDHTSILHLRYLCHYTYSNSILKSLQLNIYAKFKARKNLGLDERIDMLLTHSNLLSKTISDIRPQCLRRLNYNHYHDRIKRCAHSNTLYLHHQILL